MCRLREPWCAGAFGFSKGLGSNEGVVDSEMKLKKLVEKN